MRLHIVVLSALCLTGCEDNGFPSLVIDSASIDDAELHMSVYAESKNSETQFSFYLHHHHPDGYVQYVSLSDNDSLATASEDWSSTPELYRLPNDSESVLAYYGAVLDDDAANRLVSATLNRNQSELITAEIELLQQTEYSVIADTEPPGLQSTLSANWEAIDGYTYRLRFEFQCENSEGDTVGFKVRYPARSDVELDSPFDLDLGQFPGPSEGASNCEVEVVLVARQDQTDNQSNSGEQLDVTVLRQQSVVVPLVL